MKCRMKYIAQIFSDHIREPANKTNFPNALGF